MDALLERARIIVRRMPAHGMLRQPRGRYSTWRRLLCWATAAVLAGGSVAAQDRSGVRDPGSNTRVAELDRRLTEAQAQAQALQQTIVALAAELRALKEPAANVSAPAVTSHDHRSSYREQVLQPDLGEDERGHELVAAPELLVQSRFQALPLDGTSVEDAPTNFLLARMETRWAGRLSPKVGLGFELQYHPAPNGAAFELVNERACG